MSVLNKRWGCGRHFAHRGYGRRIGRLTFTSPFSAAFCLPLSLGDPTAATVIVGNWPVFFALMIFYLLVNATLLWSILWLFNVRWRVLT